MMWSEKRRSPAYSLVSPDDGTSLSGSETDREHLLESEDGPRRRRCPSKWIFMVVGLAGLVAYSSMLVIITTRAVQQQRIHGNRFLDST